MTDTVTQECYRAVVEEAARRGNARGLPRPVELQRHRGMGTGYGLQRYRKSDGSYRAHLFFRLTDGQSIHLGSFTIAAGTPRHTTPPTAGTIINLACGRQVRVEIDDRGLPYPVPVIGGS